MSASTQKQMELVIAKYVKSPPSAMYDIGVGPKTEWYHLKKLWPSMEVFGCEPQPHTAWSLISRDHPRYEGRLVTVAIDDHMGFTKLHFLPSDPKSSGTIKRGHHSRNIEVPAWTLDAFDQWAGRQSNILLWMDIEGMEVKALTGGKHLLESGRVSIINVEERKEDDGDPEWAQPSQVQAILASFGYKRIAHYNTHAKHHDVIYRRD